MIYNFGRYNHHRIYIKQERPDMPPIFKNTEIQYKDLSSDTKAQVKPNYKSKKLIGSMFGKRMIFLLNY